MCLQKRMLDLTGFGQGPQYAPPAQGPLWGEAEHLEPQVGSHWVSPLPGTGISPWGVEGCILAATKDAGSVSRTRCPDIPSAYWGSPDCRSDSRPPALC